MDMRQYASYTNKNARLVYLHMACTQDIATSTAAVSYRRMAAELGMTLGEVRHAVKMLQNDGLIATRVATQATTQAATHKTAQPTTHVTILINNENGAPNGAPNDTPNDTPNDIPNYTQNYTQKNNKIKIIKNITTHTYTREEWAKMTAIMAATLKIGNQEAELLTMQFIDRQNLKQKTWENQGDLIAHLVAWSEKRMIMAIKTKNNIKRTDQETRKEERQRTQEEIQTRTQEEKDQEELNRLQRWLKEWKKEGRDIAPLLSRINELKNRAS